MTPVRMILDRIPVRMIPAPRPLVMERIMNLKMMQRVRKRAKEGLVVQERDVDLAVAAAAEEG